jgi:16S rRNA (guanine966-N2)-methyltransferase
LKKPSANPSLRPVGARALKSASDTLRPHLESASVLDLYAGKGRFGAMALKEGASKVILVEKDRTTAQALRKTLDRDSDRARVVTGDVFDYLSDPPARFDVIFADPPFEDWDERFFPRLAGAVCRALSEDSIFLVKIPSRVVLSVPPPGFSTWKQTRFGESTLTYYRYGAVGND